MARPQPLPSAARVRSLLDYDADTGLFVWRSGIKVGRSAGSASGRYVQIMIEGRNYLAHRLAWLYVHGYPPPAEIDHANCDPKDNRIANLRLASKSQNAQNQTRSAKNASGHKGVSWNSQKRRWRASIKVHSRSIHLGYFKNVTEAGEAYRRAAVKHFGEFARVA